MLFSSRLNDLVNEKNIKISFLFVIKHKLHPQASFLVKNYMF